MRSRRRRSIAAATVAAMGMTVVIPAIGFAPAPMIGAASADSALPPPRGAAGNTGAGPGGMNRAQSQAQSWTARCAARLERARDEAARRWAPFREGRVEVVARELSSSGDPTAQEVYDVVEYRLATSEGGESVVFRAGGVYAATVEPRRDEGTAPTPWTEAAVLPDRTPTGHGQGHGHEMTQQREEGPYRGLLRAAAPDRTAIRTFESIFKRAVDDCLRAAAPVEAPVARGPSASAPRPAANVSPGANQTP